MWTNARSSSIVSASSKSFAVSGSMVNASRSRRSTLSSMSSGGRSYGSKPRSSPSSRSSPWSTTSIRSASPSTRSTRARPRPLRTTASWPGSPGALRSSASGVPGTKYGSPTRCFPREASSTTTASAVSSDLEETADRESRAGRAEREPGAEHDQDVQAERPRMDVGGARQVDQRHEQLAPEDEQDDRGDRAAEAAEQPFDHERPADEPVRRADELHHLDLAPPRENREP